MQVLILFLLVCLLSGGTQLGRPLRTRPLLMLVFCTAVAASFYTLRVVL